MFRSIPHFLLLIVSLQLCASVTDSVLPFMDEVYDLEFGNKVNTAQRDEMRQACSNKTAKIRVMTYNMLYNMKDAEELLPEKYQWNCRKPRLLEYIGYANPDIIGSQELQEDQVVELMEVWDSKYECYGETTRISEGRADVNAIFFNKDKFHLVDAKTVPYPDPHFENAFTVCYLKDKRGGKEIVVINTKLTWGDANRRLEEAIQLNKFVNSFSKDTPIVVLGDFNAFPCAEHERNIFLDGDFIERILTADCLVDAKRKSIFGHFGPLCSITNSKDSLNPFVGPQLTGFILDHIFVNDRINVFTHGIDTAKAFEEFPSDHFPVIADLFFL